METAISVIRKELFLFKLEQKMAYYLPDPIDQNGVKEIFDPFINEEDVFTITLEVIESIQTEQRSRADNFSCAYSSEYLGNYLLAVKSYLILSKQHYENKNQSLSIFCLEKAESLFKEATKTLVLFNVSDFLEKIGIDWLSKTIYNIPHNTIISKIY